MAPVGTSDSLEEKVLVPWDTVLLLTLSQPGREGVGREISQETDSLGTWMSGTCSLSPHGLLSAPKADEPTWQSQQCHSQHGGARPPRETRSD